MSVLTQAQFDAARLAVYDEKRQRELGEWPETIFDCVMVGTLLRGQLIMYVQRLVELSRAAGFGDRRASAMEGLTRLRGWNMIWVDPWPLIERKQASAIIGFNVIFGQWTAPLKKHCTEMQQWLSNLERPPNLREAWLERFIELQITNGFAPGGTYVRTAAFPQPGQVTRVQELEHGLNEETESSARPGAGRESPPEVRPGSNPGPEIRKREETSVTGNVTVGVDVRPATVTETTDCTGNVTVSARENGPIARPVTENVTDRSATAAAAAFPPQTPPVISEAQGSQLLGEPQRKIEGLRDHSARAREAVTKNVTESRQLLGEIERWVGIADFSTAGSRSTFNKMVVVFPRAVRRALDECYKLGDKRGYFQPDQLDAGRPAGTQHRICVFMKLMKTYAGINRFADVQPVPDPTC